MLQAIHDNLKGVFAMVILGVLAVVFVFWGVEFVSVGGLTATQGIEVDGQDVNTAEVRQDFQEQLTQYQVAFGAAEVPAELRERLKQDVVERAVRGELIRQRTDELRFRASDRDVLQMLQEIPAFQVDGKFSKDAYYAALRSANIEPAVFEAQQKQFVVARQLDRGIYASAFVLPQELTRRHALLKETREVAWFVVPAARFRGLARPDEAAVAAYYDRNRDAYRTEEQAGLQYVELDLTDLLAGVKADEESLRAFYADNRDRYASVERRRARHILVTADGDPAAAEARARAAYERAAAGEDFAVLARELSQDPGSAAQGGDLGWQDRELFVGPFADAVWAMSPGEIKGPVKTEFGWHVIKLEGVEPGQVQPFEAVRAELEEEYRRSEAESLFGDLQEKLDTVAFEAAGDLARVAESLGLDIRTAEGMTRSGGPLGASPELIKAVFDPDVLSGAQLRTVELAPGRVVTVKVVAYQPPRERPLDEVRAAVTAALEAEMSREAAAGRAESLAAELRAGGSWRELAGPWATVGADGVSTAALRFVGRSDPAAPAEVVSAAFKVPPPAGGPTYASAALPSGDAVVWTLTFVKPGSPDTLSPDERARTVREAHDSSSYRDASVYVTQLRSTADVKINPQLFE